MGDFGKVPIPSGAEAVILAKFPLSRRRERGGERDVD